MKKFKFISPILLIATSNMLALSDTQYMLKAIKLTRYNPTFPFAAIIVDNKTGKILCSGVNDTNTTHNPTHHGEIVTINNCSKKYPNLKWSQTTIYSTAEPCPMCEGAIMNALISKVVYGTSMPTLTKLGWTQSNIRAKTLAESTPFYHGKVIGGVLHNKTDPLFKRN